jgi:cytochrome bd-type quinol oxidase subunit 2
MKIFSIMFFGVISILFFYNTALFTVNAQDYIIKSSDLATQKGQDWGDDIGITVAEANGGNSGINVPSGSKLGLSENSIGETINGIIKWIMGFLAALAILMIIVAGVIYITSTGERDKTETAQKILTWAIGGLVVALLGFAIVSIISTLLGAG